MLPFFPLLQYISKIKIDREKNLISKLISKTRSTNTTHKLKSSDDTLYVLPFHDDFSHFFAFCLITKFKKNYISMETLKISNHQKLRYTSNATWQINLILNEVTVHRWRFPIIFNVCLLSGKLLYKIRSIDSKARSTVNHSEFNLHTTSYWSCCPLLVIFTFFNTKKRMIKRKEKLSTGYDL